MENSFVYNKTAFGGTEYMGKGWHKHIGPYAPKFDNYLSLIVPGHVPPVYELLNVDQQIICWMHNTPQQFDPENIKILKHQQFLNKLKNFIVPSEEHKKLLLEEIPIDPSLVVVIPNAVDPLNFDLKKFDSPKTIKLIHTSSPDRGLEILLNAVQLIEGDIELEIYNNFYPDLVPSIPEDFDSRVTFFGKTPKATVIKAIERSHVHAYPSIYPETFCMSQIEAMSAGLACVTSDIGALPEVSGGFGYMYPYTNERFKHIETFAEYANKAIQDIRDGKFDPTAQIEYTNNTYTWEKAKERWLEYHETL